MTDPYTIVGWGSSTGKLHCAACADRVANDTHRARVVKYLPVYVDSDPHAFERCIICLRVLNEVASEVKP